MGWKLAIRHFIFALACLPARQVSWFLALCSWFFALCYFHSLFIVQNL
jgi:hypothetical protein